MFSWINKRLRATPSALTVEEALWQSAERHQPWLARLGTADHARLRQLALDFLAGKVFSGANGFEPDNTVRLSIALQACLPVLNLGLGAYAGWQGLIIYPGDFVIPRSRMDADGVQHDYLEDALGEAWDGGPVVLSWFDDPADYAGVNVVIHEFAHKLDMLNGEADGLPPLHAGMDRKAWLDALDGSYDAFCVRVDQGENTWLDPYAAEDPAEFFAVCSEAFFTDADRFATEFPALHAQFVRFYRLDLSHPPR